MLTVTLANPAARNAQTPATWRALAQIGADLDPGVRAVVIKAEGPSFSAGLDRRMFVEGIPGEVSLASMAGVSDSEFDSIINKVLMVNDLHPIVLEKMGGYAISDNTFHLFNMIMYTREYIPKLNGLALNSKELALYLLLLNETFENDSVTINEAKSYKKMYFEEKDEREKNQFTRMKNLIMLVNH